jgi:hypothetical protein
VAGLFDLLRPRQPTDQLERALRDAELYIRERQFAAAEQALDFATRSFPDDARPDPGLAVLLNRRRLIWHTTWEQASGANDSITNRFPAETHHYYSHAGHEFRGRDSVGTAARAAEVGTPRARDLASIADEFVSP